MNRYVKLLVLCLSLASVPLIMAPRNGSGTYQLPAGNPVVSGTVISSTVHNNTTSDIATALTASIAKDGQTTPTANLPMGNFRHTSVGNPTLRNQYGTVDQIQDGDYVTLGSVTGTDTIAGSLSPTPTVYVAGMKVVLIPANPNTGPATLNVSSIGALDVQKWVSGAQANIVANDLRAGVPAYLVLDTGADDWVLLNPNSGNLGDVTTGALTTTALTTTALTLNGNTVGGAANPSATIGLSAVNGTANTWTRSDSAPALSPAIAPNWTAQHTFSQVTNAALAAVGSNSNSPGVRVFIGNTSPAADNRYWGMRVNENGDFRMGVWSDANFPTGSETANFMAVERTGTSVTGVVFQTDSSAAFRIGTSPAALNSSRLVVGTSSNVGAAQFENNAGSSSTPTVYITNAGTAGDSGFIRFATDSSGLGTERGSIDFNRGGTATRYNTTSDIRLKKNFKPAPSARGVIDCIKVESYDWKETGHHVDHGFVAQRLNKCAPYAVKGSNDPSVTWGVDPSKLVPALIKYVQEQDARISRLEADAARRH